MRIARFSSCILPCVVFCSNVKLSTPFSGSTSIEQARKASSECRWRSTLLRVQYSHPPEEINEDFPKDYGRLGESEGKQGFVSKAKWKKKRFLLMQDVKQQIKRNDPKAPRTAEEMVKRMLNMYEKSGDSEYIPTIQAYNLWIHALAKSSIGNAGAQAEMILDEMKERNIEPNAITYTSVMDAYARSKNPERAEKVLFRLLEDANNGNEELSSVTCDTILNAWAQQGTPESAERAQTILLRLEKWQRNDIRPTKISYATVLNGWAKVGSHEAAEKADALLHRMLKTGELEPDNVVFNAAINAWATSKDSEAGEKAAKLLEEMVALASAGHDTRPDIVTYNTVLSAWSHSGHTNAAPQAEKLVQEMMKLSKESDEAPSPNAVSYNSILNAWSKSSLPGAALRCKRVLDYMIKVPNENVKPDMISFTTVMDALAKSKESNKALRCSELLARMSAFHRATGRIELKPNAYAYNVVLNACAFSAMGTPLEEQREALQIAVSTFTSMRKSGVSPDTVTYGNMLKCLANLMPQGNMRSKMALQIFDRCTEDGMVGALVWNEVRRAVPTKTLDSTYSLKKSVGRLEVRDLPRRWRESNRNDKNAPKSKEKKQESTPKRPVSRTTITETTFQFGKDA